MYPGTWGGQFSLVGADVDVVGIGGREVTFLDGAGDAPIIQILAGETSTIRGFAVSGASHGPAAYLLGSTVDLSDVHITGNGGGGTFAGGGLHIEDSVVRVEDAVIDDNVQSYGVGEHGVEAVGYGGGIYVSNSQLELSNVTLSGNVAGAYGGGLFVNDASDVGMTSVRLSENQAKHYDAGAVYAEDGSALTLMNVLVEGNMAIGCWCAYDSYYLESIWSGGGTPGIEARHSHVTATNSVFADNQGLAAGTEAGLSGSDYLVSHSILTGEIVSAPSGTYSHTDVWGSTSTLLGDSNTPTNVSVDPAFSDTLWHLDPTSPLVNSGDPSRADPDGSTADIGLFGGPDAGEIDADGDGWGLWWLPGPYDPATSPEYDCDDENASVYPGAGC